MNSLNNNNRLFGLNIKKIIRGVLIIVPLGILGNIIYIYIFARPGIIMDLGNISITYLFFAAALALFPWPSQSLRIMIWGRIFGKTIGPGQAFRAVLASDITAAVTPTMLGGGYAKLGYLAAYGFTAGEAAMVTLLGTLEDGVFFLIALPSALWFSRAWDNPYVILAGRDLISHWPAVLMVIALMLSALLVVNRFISGNKKGDHPSGYSRRALKSIGKFWTDLKTASDFVLRNGKESFIACVLIAGLGWCGRYGAVSVLVLGLGYPADPVLFFLLQWVVFTTMTMIPTPGAVGGAEVSFSLVYSGLIPSPVIPIAAAVWRFVTFYLPVGLGSLIFALYGSGIPGNKSESSSFEIMENVKT